MSEEIAFLVRFAMDDGAVEREFSQALRLQQWYRENRAQADAAIKARYQPEYEQLKGRLDALAKTIQQHPFYRLMVREDRKNPVRLSAAEIPVRRREYAALVAERKSLEAEIRKIDVFWRQLHGLESRICGEQAKRAKKVEGQKEDARRRLRAVATEDFAAIREAWQRFASLVQEEESRQLTVSEVTRQIEKLLSEAGSGAFRTNSGDWLVRNPNHVEPAADAGLGRPDLAVVRETPPSECTSWTQWKTSCADEVEQLVALRTQLRLYLDWQSDVRRDWTARLREGWKKVLQAQDVTCQVPLLSGDDYRLCLLWAGSSPGPTQRDAETELFKTVGGHEAVRLISARGAELVAKRFYEQSNAVVTDVSIGQLRGADSDWKRFDLAVDGLPVDVKNARRAFSSPNTYVEHVVPRFKLARSERTVHTDEVTILGILSDYLTPEDVHRGGHGTADVLGEVRQSDLRRLAEWSNHAFEGRLRLDGLIDGGFLPGWVFGYPRHAYPCRDAELPGLLRLEQDARSAGLLAPVGCSIRGLVAVLSEHFCGPSEWSEIERSLIGGLKSMTDSIGLSRRGLFVFALGSMLKAIEESRELHCAEALWRILYATDDKARVRPLSLMDHHEYVSTLIDLLAKAGSDIRTQLGRIKYYRLTHSQILRGIDVNGRVVTVYAYCGGRRKLKDGKSVACGRNPLFIGSASVCSAPGCGRLVCPDCGFCCRTCSENGPRQLSWQSSEAEYL